MTSITMQPDVFAELDAFVTDWPSATEIVARIKAQLGAMLSPDDSPAEQPQASKPQTTKRKSSARDFGMGRVSYRKTPCGFLEPVVTMPSLAIGSRPKDMAEYHSRLLKMGCEPVGTDEATGATVYRTPEGKELKVRSLGGRG